MNVSALKKAFAALIAAIIAISCFTACKRAAPQGGPAGPSPAPVITYTATHYIRYWPEDAGYDDCVYSAVIELPEFSKTFTAGYNMNQAVNDYLDDLQKRVENEYIPASAMKKPHTEVSLEVDQIPGCTNVIFTETHSYLESEYTRTHVLMLDDHGLPMNLCDVFLDYHTAERAAELIASKEHCPVSDALGRIDITNGARATLAGCTLYLRSANAGGAEQRVDLGFDELSPASDLGGISAKEYKKLEQLLHFAADAAVVRQENIVGGTLTPFEASSFMGEYVMSLGAAPEAGRINVGQTEFEGYYRNIFGSEFPGVDTDGHDIKLENGVYAVLNKPKPYEYHMDITNAAVEGGIVTLTGDLIFGPFGYAYTQYVCHLTVMLEKSAESPFGYKLVDFMMSA